MNVANKPGDKFKSRQYFCFSKISIMIKKRISNKRAVITFNPSFTNWRSFNIFSKIINVFLFVIRVFSKVNNPCFSLAPYIMWRQNVSNLIV